jgi:hypothetical protein
MSKPESSSKPESKPESKKEESTAPKKLSKLPTASASGKPSAKLDFSKIKPISVAAPASKQSSSPSDEED